MQSANTEILDDICFELLLITDAAEDSTADVQAILDDANSALVNLRAAKQSGVENTDYINTAKEHITALCATVDVEGPYHGYAQNAKTLMNQL